MMGVVVRGAREAVMGSVSDESVSRLCAACAMPCKQDVRCVVVSCPRHVSVREGCERDSGDVVTLSKGVRHG